MDGAPFRLHVDTDYLPLRSVLCLPENQVAAAFHATQVWAYSPHDSIASRRHLFADPFPLSGGTGKYRSLPLEDLATLAVADGVVFLPHRDGIQPLHRIDIRALPSSPFPAGNRSREEQGAIGALQGAD